MRVRIYTVDQTTDEETMVGQNVALSEALPDGDSDAEAELEQYGVAFVGGGAAQLFKLVRIECDNPRCGECGNTFAPETETLPATMPWGPAYPRGERTPDQEDLRNALLSQPPGTTLADLEG